MVGPKKWMKIKMSILDGTVNRICRINMGIQVMIVGEK